MTLLTKIELLKADEHIEKLDLSIMKCWEIITWYLNPGKHLAVSEHLKNIHWLNSGPFTPGNLKHASINTTYIGSHLRII